jgi:hypothetical protein
VPALFGLRPSTILYSILALAAALRLWGIAFGLPYDGITYDSLTIEEIQEVHRALKLGAGEYAWVFGKGGLYLILFVEYGVLFVLSWLFGWVDSGREFALRVLEDRTTIYLMGRVTVALIGVATCYVIYQIARRTYDERVALGAALIGAVSYFHAVFSAVINVDVGATLGVWLSLLVYLHYEATGKTRYLVGAGVVAAVAIAFKMPGAVALPMIWVALATAARDGWTTSHVIKNGAIVFIALIVTLTAIAPEWITSIADTVRYNFLAAVQSAYASAGEPDLRTDIKSITVMRDEWTGGYLKHLIREYNVVLTATAAFAAVLGVIKKNRWDLILTGLIVVFVGVMSLSDRTQPERYILPIMPALWILGSRGAVELGRYRRWLPAASFALIVAVPLFWLVRAAVEKTHVDTRIHAKTWIEANVPDGARILMDGMRYRFSQSPPLNPDSATVGERVERARDEGGNFGRGVSDFALSVYEEAQKKVKGPKYELVSTVHGIQVRNVSYYVNECFDYIVTSSIVAGRFRPGKPARRLFPESAKFYDALESDPRLRLVHEESEVRWGKTGPTIKIYEVASRCDSR